MRFILKIILIYFFSISLSFSETNFQQKKFYYENLVKNWTKIFPDGNRNAAGPKFFKYIIDKKITYKDFIEFNKLYCAVSGSLIDPGSDSEFLFVKENKTKRSVETNQTASNLRYEIRFFYTLKLNAKDCVTYKKELSS